MEKKLEIKSLSKKLRSILWKFYSDLKIGGNSSWAAGVRVGAKTKKYRNHALQVSKLPESFWNLHQSIRNKISDVSSAAEHFLTRSELWDRRFLVFRLLEIFFLPLPFLCPFVGKNFYKWFRTEKMKILYLRALKELENVPQHYEHPKFYSWSIGEGFRTIQKVFRLVERDFDIFRSWCLPSPKVMTPDFRGKLKSKWIDLEDEKRFWLLVFFIINVYVCSLREFFSTRIASL